MVHTWRTLPLAELQFSLGWAGLGHKLGKHGACWGSSGHRILSRLGQGPQAQEGKAGGPEVKTSSIKSRTASAHQPVIGIHITES